MIQKIPITPHCPLCPWQSVPHPTLNLSNEHPALCCSIFIISGFSLNCVILHIFICFCYISHPSLSTVLLIFIYIVACISNLFFYIELLHCILWICQQTVLGNWISSTYKRMKLAPYLTLCENQLKVD